VKRISHFAMVTACAFVAYVMPLSGATLQRLSMNDLISKSTSIVRGTVTSSWAAFTGPIIYTHYKIQVSERFKGVPSSTVEIMVPGGTVNNLHQAASGSPALNQGDDCVFFLWTSDAGITWIMGLTQGLFVLPAGSPAANATATRQATRELMLDAVTGRAVKDIAMPLQLTDLRAQIAAWVAAQGGAK
jgi:hypothetical protein